MFPNNFVSGAVGLLFMSVGPLAMAADSVTLIHTSSYGDYESYHPESKYSGQYQISDVKVTGWKSKSRGAATALLAFGPDVTSPQALVTLKAGDRCLKLQFSVWKKSTASVLALAFKDAKKIEIRSGQDGSKYYSDDYSCLWIQPELSEIKVTTDTGKTKTLDVALDEYKEKLALQDAIGEIEKIQENMAKPSQSVFSSHMNEIQLDKKLKQKAVIEQTIAEYEESNSSVAK